MSQFGGIPVSSGSKFGGRAVSPRQEPPAQTGITDRLRQGMADFYIGTGQVANAISDKIGVGDFDLQNMQYISPEEVKRRREVFAGAAGDLRQQEGEVGLGGGLLQALGNPTTWATGPLALAAPLSAGLATLFRAEPEDIGLADRAENATVNAAIARVAAPVIDKVIRSTGSAIAKTVAHPLDTAKRLTSPIARKALEADNPITGAEGLKRALASDYAKEGARLEGKLGVQFSAAEKTGNQRAVAIEDYLANSPHTAEAMYANTQGKVDNLTGQFDRQLDAVSAKPAGALSVGGDASKAYDGVISRIRDARRTQAAFDFGKADKLAKGAPVVAPNNVVGALQKFIDEANGGIATPAQKEAGKQAQAMLRNMTRTEQVIGPATNKVFEGQRTVPGFGPGGVEVMNAPRPLTIRDLQSGLSTYTDAGKTTGGIWKDIGTAADRRFANEMKTALLKDMDEAIAAGGDDTIRPAIQALQTARDRYKGFSDQLEQVRETVLGKYLGAPGERTPERVAEQLLTMRPSEITATLKVLDRADPTASASARRFFLENALTRATDGVGQSQAGLRSAQTVNVKTLLKSLPSDEHLEAILGGKPGLAPARADISDIVSALNRIATYGGTKGGSPTATRSETASLIRAPLQFAKRAALDAALPSNIAEIMMNPTQRRAAAQAARKNDTSALLRIIGGAGTRAVTLGAVNRQNAKPEDDDTGPVLSPRDRGVGGASSSLEVQPGRSIPPFNQSAATTMQKFARAESGGNPNAKNANSSASGKFQFTDDTWVRAVRKWGRESGVTLRDKNDPKAQEVMARKLAADNAGILTKTLARKPTVGDLYVAHVLGAPDAIRLIRAQGTGRQALTLFAPNVVAANRPLFFAGKTPRTVEALYTLLTDKMA